MTFINDKIRKRIMNYTDNQNIATRIIQLSKLDENQPTKEYRDFYAKEFKKLPKEYRTTLRLVQQGKLTTKDFGSFTSEFKHVVIQFNETVSEHSSSPDSAAGRIADQIFKEYNIDLDAEHTREEEQNILDLWDQILIFTRHRHKKEK